MTQSNKICNVSNIVWIDCEMTGLDAQTDVLLEIAVIVTDKDLNILGEGPNLVIHQSDEVWFKITKSLIFNIASEASYVYILIK